MNKVVLACSGASDVGEIADRAARLVHACGAATMVCASGLLAGHPEYLRTVQSAKAVVLVEGCEVACGRTCILASKMPNFLRIQLQEMGMLRHETRATREQILKVANRIIAALNRAVPEARSPMLTLADLERLQPLPEAA